MGQIHARTKTGLTTSNAATQHATSRIARASAQANITEYLTDCARAETWQALGYTQVEQRFKEQVRAGSILASDLGLFTAPAKV